MNRPFALLAAMAIALTPAKAWAHAHLKRSEPAAGARLSASPIGIRLWFSEQPELPMTFAALQDSEGKEIPLSQPERGEPGQMQIVFRILGILSPGRYTLTWRTAASDGHPSHGTFSFSVMGSSGIGAGPPPIAPLAAVGSAGRDSLRAVLVSGSPVSAEEETDGASSVGNSVARALLFTSLLALIGAVTFRTLVLPRAGAVNRQLRDLMEERAALLGIIASAVLIVVALARLGLESQMMRAMPDMPGMMGMSARDMVMRTEWGFVLRLQLIAAAVALTAFILARGRAGGAWSVAAVAAIVLAVTPALGGHAAASPRFTSLMIAADFLHVLGGATWLGSLLAVMMIGVPIAVTAGGAERWSCVETLVESFSPLALVSAAIVVASGLFASWIHLERLPALWQTSYGQVLIVKLCLVATTFGIGAYNFKRVQPQLSTEGGTRHLRRSAAVELGVGFLILLVTGLLTGISP